MKLVPAFWDSSALVPLCLHEASTRQAQSQLRKLAPVVWWGSLTEVRSAIARLHHGTKISDAQKHAAVSRLTFLARSWKEILPDNELRDLANRLLDLHILRAADSLQLAAALIWCQQRPARRSFVCADHRLSKAAKAAGFSVTEI